MKEQPSALTRSTQAVTRDTRMRELLAETNAGPRRRIIWIDGVGGYLLLDREEVVLGQAVSGNTVDIGIVGDLSRQAAAIRRSGGDYLLQPLQPTTVGGKVVERPQLLSDGDRIQFGERVQLSFAKPNPLSGTACLSLASIHRFKPHVDGVLLLADSCIIGPSAGSHVRCPSWRTELLLFRHGDEWFFRTFDEVEVDGRSQKGQIPLVAGMRMNGEDFSLSVE